MSAETRPPIRGPEFVMPGYAAAPTTPPAAPERAAPPRSLGGLAERPLTWARALPTRDLAAIVLAGVGTLLLYVSFLVDWQIIELDTGRQVHAGIAEIPTWGTVYVLSAMVLVALFVCVVALPTSLGGSSRVIGIAWAFGVAGILTAVLVRLTDTPVLVDGALPRELPGGPAQVTGVDASWGWGPVSAAVGVALLTGAFFAACPPLRDIEASADEADGRLDPRD